MGLEIERKFLVVGDKWKKQQSGTIYRQGYLTTVKERTVRVRIIGEIGYLTIKGISIGATRKEFEYQIPFEDASQLLEMCEQPIIEKIRYKIEYEGLTWEVDEFLGINKGLLFAEVELQEEDQQIVIPDWIGTEVTGDVRYFNSNLVKYPFTMWE